MINITTIFNCNWLVYYFTMFQVNFIQRKNSSLLLGAGGSEKSTYETVKKQTGVILKNHWVCMKQLIHNAFFFSFPTVTCGWDHGPCFFQRHFQFIFELRQTLGYVFKGALRRSSRWAIWRIPGSGEMLWNIRRIQKWSFFKQSIINLNDLIQVYDICCNVHFRHLDRIVLFFRPLKSGILQENLC